MVNGVVIRGTVSFVRCEAGRTVARGVSFARKVRAP